MNSPDYTWFKLSCNQPFLPDFEFLFEYLYDVTFHVTTLIQPWLIQCLKRKFLKSFLQLLELNCMAVQEKQLYLREGSRPKIEPCLNMLEWYLSFLLPTPQLQHLQQPNRPLLLILPSNEIGNSLIIRKYSCKTSLFTVKWWGNLCLLKNHV